MAKGMVRAALVCGAAAIGLTAGASAAPRQAVRALDDLAARFGAREAIASPALSPDGKRVVYLTADHAAGTMAMVAAVDGSSPPTLAVGTNGAATRVTGCDWADDTRLVCTAYAIAEADGMSLTFVRLFAIDPDGKRMQTLSQTPTGAGLALRRSQFDGAIVDWRKGDDGKVLLARDHVPERDIGTRLAHTQNGYGVDLVDTHSMSSSAVEPGEVDAVAFLSDGKGAVRMKAMQKSRSIGYLKPGTDWFYRKAGDRRWLPFSKRTEEGGGLLPVAVDGATDAVFCLERLNGRDALYRVALDGTMAKTLVHADPAGDVTGAIRLGRQARLIGATTTSETHGTVYFDPAYKALAASLSKALPKLPIVDFVSASADENKLLIFAGSDVDPGRYYVFDRTTKHLNEIMLVRPQLENQALATMTAVSYPAADGTAIPAFLTMPPSGARTNIPAIVLPHGGPASRDEWGFDWLVQFYAMSGYAVLQPEYRGSTGYGDDWQLKNGFRSWRTAIGDVADAGRWLVAKGIADPKRLAIVGWSYGGYAALQAQVVAPGLFKASVAIAPVTDFAALRQEASNYTNSGLVASYVGSGPEAVAGSPIRHVDAFTAPVLMFHGTLDRNVSVEETRAMSARLRDAGKPASAVIYDALDHGLPSGEIRADMLRRSDAFLRSTLGMGGGQTTAAEAQTKTGA